MSPFLATPLCIGLLSLKRFSLKIFLPIFQKKIHLSNLKNGYKIKILTEKLLINRLRAIWPKGYQHGSLRINYKRLIIKALASKRQNITTNLLEKLLL